MTQVGNEGTTDYNDVPKANYGNTPMARVIADIDNKHTKLGRELMAVKSMMQIQIDELKQRVEALEYDQRGK